MLPIDLDVHVKIKGYHNTYYYQKGKKKIFTLFLSKFQYFSNGITLFKGTTTLDGKTWLDGTIFLGHKKYIKRKKMLCFIQKYKNLVGQRT